MKISLKSVAFSIVSLFAISPVLLSTNPVSAQLVNHLGTGGMDGSYVGGGLSVGVNSPDDDTTVGGNVQARIAIPKVPVSVRGAALFGDNATAIMPLVTADIGVAKNTNVYVGGGYSFVDGSGISPLGDQDAPVAVVGVETAVHPHVVLYSDVKVGFDSFKANSDAAVGVQVGAAYRF